MIPLILELATFAPETSMRGFTLPLGSLFQPFWKNMRSGQIGFPQGFCGEMFPKSLENHHLKGYLEPVNVFDFWVSRPSKT